MRPAKESVKRCGSDVDDNLEQNVVPMFDIPPASRTYRMW